MYSLSCRNNGLVKTPFYLSCFMVFFLYASTLSAQWVQQGPGPSTEGQVEGITDRPISGAINCVTPHPSDGDILYIGATNGGIWRTLDATSATPSWTFISSGLTSLAIGALEFDPTDASNQTMVVGSGYTSSLGSRGAGARGVFRTTTGTEPWTDIDPNGTVPNINVTGIAPRGATIVLAGSSGIWRTTDTGTNWIQISGGVGTGIPFGLARDLVSDPSDNTILYTTAAANGIYKSTDTGATWNKVSDAAIDALLPNSANIELAVGVNNNVYAAIVAPSPNDALIGLFRSGDGGANWTALDLPTTNEGGTPVGIHPGNQGSRHLSLAADLSDNNVVYVGGDRQAGPLPNSIGATNWTGRLFRVDASLVPGSQSAAITHNGTAGNSSPHADSRDMDFDANGNLIEGDDGGVYRQSSPDDATGDWFSLIGNINNAEVHSMDWDANANIIISGLQDNGVPEQKMATNPEWRNVRNGDGGDVLVDDITSPNVSTRFLSTQRLGGFRMRSYNTANAFQAGTQSSPALTSTATGLPLATGNGGAFPFVTPLEMNSQNGSRLLFAGNADLYESLDQGTTLTPLLGSAINTASGTDTMAYGASDNVNIIYAGQGASVLVRTTAAGALNAAAGYAGQNVRGISIDQNDSQSAYVIDSNQVFETTDTGANFDDITGNLNALNPGSFRSIAYVSNSTDDMLAVGTDQNVYIAAGPDFDVWAQLSPELPNVRVDELVYDATDQILVAGTFGRGVWTYNLSERDPVDIAIVLDMSGSMLSVACAGCDPKIDVLKGAVEIFMQIWKALAVGGDLVTTVYFRTTVDALDLGGNTNLPVILNTDDIIDDIKSQTTTISSLTALGGGVQEAINQLSDATRPRHIILFTDGMQNVDPGVSFPDMEIINDEYGPNSNINPTVPPTVLDNALGIKVHTIGVGATPAFETQLSDISTATDGLTKITTVPDDDLIQFYIEELVEVLKDFSPQLVAYRRGVVNRTTTELFAINTSSNQILFKISYGKGEKLNIRIRNGGVDVTNLAEKTTGEFYQILHYPFDILTQINSSQYAGEWDVTITKGGPATKYQIGVIADEEVLDFDLGRIKHTLFAGQPIKLFADLRINGKPLRKDTSVKALISYPRVAMGSLLAKEKMPEGRHRLKFEKGTPIGEQKLAALRQDPRFVEKTKPLNKTIELKINSGGQFVGQFHETKLPGAYTIDYIISGKNKATGPIERIETRTVVVRFGKLNRNASMIQVKHEGYTDYIWSITPQDIFGNLLGPDHEKFLNINVEKGKLKGIKDEGNGTYRLHIVSEAGSEPQLMVRYYGDVWFNDSLAK